VIDELGARECVVGYGLSEASPNVAQSCWWEDEAVRVAARMRPQPGIEVRVDAAPGEMGEIRVRGYTVMQGYFDKPAETQAALSADGWLSTGDLGRMGPDGRLEFTGRAKDLIRVGGENVSPAEVEDVLNRHPAVRQAVVVGVPDPRLMEVPCAFVILNEGQPEDGAAEAIMDWGRGQMAGFKAPRHVRIVAGFERIGMTASSKIQKNLLREHAIDLLGLR
jgi:fatty-acyl-CoA synthase